MKESETNNLSGYGTWIKDAIESEKNYKYKVIEEACIVLQKKYPFIEIPTYAFNELRDSLLHHKIWSLAKKDEVVANSLINDVGSLILDKAIEKYGSLLRKQNLNRKEIERLDLYKNDFKKRVSPKDNKIALSKRILNFLYFRNFFWRKEVKSWKSFYSNIVDTAPEYFNSRLATEVTIKLLDEFVVAYSGVHFMCGKCGDLSGVLSGIPPFIQIDSLTYNRMGGANYFLRFECYNCKKPIYALDVKPLSPVPRINRRDIFNKYKKYIQKRESEMTPF